MKTEDDKPDSISLRDYFAAKAMANYVETKYPWSDTEIAKAAYKMADAMMDARGIPWMRAKP